jgi:SAM-dependent methyltransferase
MPAMKLFYDWMYRYSRAPWDLGPRKELVEVVKNRRIEPCKAIDLGCGTASNAIFLAGHGFDVTGTDYSSAAIALCQKRGAEAGVSVNWGVYDDLNQPDRRAYLRNILPLTHAHSRFLIYVHQWPLRWWERLLHRVFGGMQSMQPGEVQADFDAYFDIETIAERRFPGYIAGEAVYLMTRKGETK